MRFMNIVTMLVLFFLLFVSPLAQAMFPQEGVYEKIVDGRVIARMHVIEGEGTGDGQGKNLGTIAAPYLYLESYGENAAQLATYWAGKTPEAGAGEFGVLLDKKNTELAIAGETFIVTYFGAPLGTQTGVFYFTVPDEAEVTDCGVIFDGKYLRNKKESVNSGAALAVFAFERTYSPDLFFDKETDRHYYTYTKYGENVVPGYRNFTIRDTPKGEILHQLFLDDGLHFVMKENLMEIATWRNLFTSRDYTAWAAKSMAIFCKNEILFPNQIYVLQYLTMYHPDMTADNRYRIHLVDFYGGEGEGAIYTSVYDVERYDETDGMLLTGTVNACSNGEILIRKCFGQSTVRGDEVRVRAKPDLNGEILTYYNRGTPVSMEGYVQGTFDEPGYRWARIRMPDGRVGYVHSDYVKDLRES